MIDDLLRESFARHEGLVPAADNLRPRIAAGISRRRLRRARLRSAAAAFVLVLLVATPLVLLRAQRPAGHGQATPGATTTARQFLIVVTDPVIAVVLVQVDPASRSVFQISIPRGVAVHGAGTARTTLGDIVAAGGYQPVAAAVGGLLGVPLAGGAVVGKGGVQRAVSVVGNIEFCVDRRVVSRYIGFDHDGRERSPIDDRGRPVSGVHPLVYEVGCRSFTGWETADYLRQSADPDATLRRVFAAVAARVPGPHQFASALATLGPSVELHPPGTRPAAWTLLMSGVDTGHLLGARLPVDASAHAVADLSTALRTGTMPDWLLAHPHDVD